MNIYEAIKADHDEHRRLLNDLAETSGDSLKRRTLWTKFYYDVKAHAAAEEENLYAELTPLWTVSLRLATPCMNISS